jgi:purine nucleosidase
MITKKVLLDVDPGIDDAVALCLALFDSHVDVVAVTAVGGNVPPDQATRNVQAIIEHWIPALAADWRGFNALGLPTRSVQLHGADVRQRQFRVSGCNTAILPKVIATRFARRRAS